MMIRKKRTSPYFEPGTPFKPFAAGYDGAESALRVMPPQFRYPTLPAACTFVRDLHHDDLFSL